MLSHDLRGWATGVREQVSKGADDRGAGHDSNTAKHAVCESRPPPIGAQTVVKKIGVLLSRRSVDSDQCGVSH